MNSYKKYELYQEAIKFEGLEDYKEAFNLYLASAKQGYPRAQLVVAKYYLGDGLYKGIIKVNMNKAIDYLQQAAAGGNAEAKYRLAIILLGQNENKTLAFELLRDASDRQYYLATVEVAKCYFRGIGVKQSYSNTLTVIENLVYGRRISAQNDCYDEIKDILEEIKTLAAEQKDKMELSGDDWCLFKDLCNDFRIAD